MLLASCAFAQRGSQFDVSGNLSFSGNNSAAITGIPSRQVNAFGWQTSGDSHLNRWLSLTSEFGYASADAGDIFGLTSPDSASVHHYSLLGGPRITVPVSGRFTPFVEGLAGWDRATTKATTSGVTFTGTDLQTAYAFGGGAQIALNRRISFRVQADYFGTEHSSTFLGWEPSHLRVAGGIVIRVVGPRDPRRLAVERPPTPSPSRKIAASNIEDKVAETVKPVEAQPMMVASAPAPTPNPVAQPAIQPAIQPKQQPQPQPAQSQAVAEWSTPAAKTQQATPVLSVAAPPKAANPPAVMAGVVIITPPAQQPAQTRAAMVPATVAPTAAPVQQAQAEPEPLSLGEYARRVRAKKQQQQ
jgi:opacity protein-like surface antigen